MRCDLVNAVLVRFDLTHEAYKCGAMEMQTATLRELRENFPAIRRRVDRYGEVVVMHRGKPFYVITRLASQKPKRPLTPLPDFWERLQEQQPKPLTEEQAKALLDENRG